MQLQTDDKAQLGAAYLLSALYEAATLLSDLWGDWEIG